MRVGVALAVLMLLPGCGRTNYADDPDLGAVRSAFGCVKRFEAAGAVRSYPAHGTTGYLGRLDCSRDAPTGTIVFGLRGLRPGTSPAKADPAHQPAGVVVTMMSSTAPTPLRHRVADKTMAALRAGTKLELTAEESADGLFPTDWRGWADRLTSANTPLPTARSDGTSLLESPGHIPAFWDDADESSAFGFLREIDDELIYVRPPAGPGREACVGHFWKLPVP
ncbi:MAG: hypothetical protein ACOC1F_09380 [Myxococcota bacterium]